MGGRPGPGAGRCPAAGASPVCPHGGGDQPWVLGWHLALHSWGWLPMGIPFSVSGGDGEMERDSDIWYLQKQKLGDESR